MAVPDVAITPWPTAAPCAISHAAILACTILLSVHTEPSRAHPAADRSATIALAAECGQTSFVALNPHSRLSSLPAASFNPA
jgi:hypothetical protein